MSSCGAISVGNCSFCIELKSKVARLNTELVKQRSRASNYKRHHERSKLPEAKAQPQKLKTELANELKLLAKVKRLFFFNPPGQKTLYQNSQVRHRLAHLEP